MSVVVVVKKKHAIVEIVLTDAPRVRGHHAQLPQHQGLRGGRVEHPRRGVLLKLGRFAGAKTHHAPVGAFHEELSLIGERDEHVPRRVHRHQHLATDVLFIGSRLGLSSAAAADGQLQYPRGEVVISE